MWRPESGWAHRKMILTNQKCCVFILLLKVNTWLLIWAATFLSSSLPGMHNSSSVSQTQRCFWFKPSQKASAITGLPSLESFLPRWTGRDRAGWEAGFSLAWLGLIYPTPCWPDNANLVSHCFRDNKKVDIRKSLRRTCLLILWGRQQVSVTSTEQMCWQNRAKWQPWWKAKASCNTDDFSMRKCYATVSR